MSRETLQMLKRMLEVNPQQRISARELLRLPIMQKTLEDFVGSYELAVNRSVEAAKKTSSSINGGEAADALMMTAVCDEERWLDVLKSHAKIILTHQKRL